ncbi:MAG: hypothetical protein QOE88_422 [Verrucomicrobiota bacterium]|nr:hypothetical protein [Verrucomicrobiota bacterium]
MNSILSFAGRAKKNVAPASIPRSPQTPAMGFHEGAADPKPHPHSMWFSGIERLKETFQCFRFDAVAQILHRDPHRRLAAQLVALARNRLRCVARPPRLSSHRSRSLPGSAIPAGAGRGRRIRAAGLRAVLFALRCGARPTTGETTALVLLRPSAVTQAAG